MPRMSKPCRRCGKQLAVGSKSLPEPTCHQCRRLRAEPYGERPAERRRARRLHSLTCAQCGDAFAHGRSDKQFCSKRCAGDNRRAPQKICEVCQALFWPRRDRRKLCSRRCALALLTIRAAEARAARTPDFSPPRPPRPCTVCGSLMHKKGVKYCSYACQVRVCGQRVIDLYRLACQHGWSGARWRELLVGYLRERDGSDCRICRSAIRFDLRSGTRGDPSGLGPSVDHVVPRSERGDDSLANLRLAHWKCNRDRGNRGGYEQLMLVG